ncbi:MAG: HDOD domain-containing protein [Candidatus Contendobacter sp.]|nr:HDOD domain-containing protein [Candidatus Contendobacter sp.]
MLSRLFAFFSNRRIRNRAAAEQRDFQMLNALAPVKGADAAGAPAAPPENSEQAGSSSAVRSVICREAVLNREQRVAGYEFMLRGKIHDQMRTPNRRPHYRFYNEVMINHLLQDSVSRLLGHRQAFVTVLGSFLANPLFDRLLGQGMVLTALLLDSDAPRLLPERVNELKQRGFKFALEEGFKGAQFEALAPQADYFILRTSDHNPAEIQQITEQISRRYRNAAFVARDLESFDDFQLCSKLGFTLFQGPFVTRREDWTDNQVGPQTLHVCDLLNHLRREADTTELARLLMQDTVLSYRLLRYINSAASGLRQPIASIEHALVLMGRQTMYRWLTLILFGSAQNAPHAAALQENALVRGRFMELISAGAFAEAERDNLFVTGLFSMLDLVLRIPLPTAIKPLNLPAAIEAALLRNEGPYAPFLDLALACESPDQDRIQAAAAKCGVETAAVNTQHFEALTWAQAIQF